MSSDSLLSTLTDLLSHRSPQPISHLYAQFTQTRGVTFNDAAGQSMNSFLAAHPRRFRVEPNAMGGTVHLRDDGDGDDGDEPAPQQQHPFVPAAAVAAATVPAGSYAHPYVYNPYAAAEWAGSGGYGDGRYGDDGGYGDGGYDDGGYGDGGYGDGGYDDDGYGDDGGYGTSGGCDDPNCNDPNCGCGDGEPMAAPLSAPVPLPFAMQFPHNPYVQSSMDVLALQQQLMYALPHLAAVAPGTMPIFSPAPVPFVHPDSFKEAHIMEQLVPLLRSAHRSALGAGGGASASAGEGCVLLSRLLEGALWTPWGRSLSAVHGDALAQKRVESFLRDHPHAFLVREREGLPDSTVQLVPHAQAHGAARAPPAVHAHVSSAPASSASAAKASPPTFPTAASTPQSAVGPSTAAQPPAAVAVTSAPHASSMTTAAQAAAAAVVPAAAPTAASVSAIASRTGSSSSGGSSGSSGSQAAPSPSAPIDLQGVLVRILRASPNQQQPLSTLAGAFMARTGHRFNDACAASPSASASVSGSTHGPASHANGTKSGLLGFIMQRPDVFHVQPAARATHQPVVSLVQGQGQGQGAPQPQGEWIAAAAAPAPATGTPRSGGVAAPVPASLASAPFSAVLSSRIVRKSSGLSDALASASVLPAHSASATAPVPANRATSVSSIEAASAAAATSVAALSSSPATAVAGATSSPPSPTSSSSSSSRATTTTGPALAAAAKTAAEAETAAIRLFLSLLPADGRGVLSSNLGVLFLQQLRGLGVHSSWSDYSRPFNHRTSPPLGLQAWLASHPEYFKVETVEFGKTFVHRAAVSGAPGGAPAASMDARAAAVTPDDNSSSSDGVSSAHPSAATVAQWVRSILLEPRPRPISLTDLGQTMRKRHGVTFRSSAAPPGSVLASTMRDFLRAHPHLFELLVESQAREDQRVQVHLVERGGRGGGTEAAAAASGSSVVAGTTVPAAAVFAPALMVPRTHASPLMSRVRKMTTAVLAPEFDAPPGGAGAEGGAAPPSSSSGSSSSSSQTPTHAQAQARVEAQAAQPQPHAQMHPGPSEPAAPSQWSQPSAPGSSAPLFSAVVAAASHPSPSSSSSSSSSSASATTRAPAPASAFPPLSAAESAAVDLICSLLPVNGSSILPSSLGVAFLSSPVHGFHSWSEYSRTFGGGPSLQRWMERHPDRIVVDKTRGTTPGKVLVRRAAQPGHPLQLQHVGTGAGGGASASTVGVHSPPPPTATILGWVCSILLEAWPRLLTLSDLGQITRRKHGLIFISASSAGERALRAAAGAGATSGSAPPPPPLTMKAFLRAHSHMFALQQVGNEIKVRLLDRNAAQAAVAGATAGTSRSSPAPARVTAPATATSAASAPAPPSVWSAPATAPSYGLPPGGWGVASLSDERLVGLLLGAPPQEAGPVTADDEAGSEPYPVPGRPFTPRTLLASLRRTPLASLWTAAFPDWETLFDFLLVHPSLFASSAGDLPDRSASTRWVVRVDAAASVPPVRASVADAALLHTIEAIFRTAASSQQTTIGADGLQSPASPALSLDAIGRYFLMDRDVAFESDPNSGGVALADFLLRFRNLFVFSTEGPLLVVRFRPMEGAAAAAALAPAVSGPESRVAADVGVPATAARDQPAPPFFGASAGADAASDVAAAAAAIPSAPGSVAASSRVRKMPTAVLAAAFDETPRVSQSRPPLQSQPQLQPLRAQQSQTAAQQPAHFRGPPLSHATHPLVAPAASADVSDWLGAGVTFEAFPVVAPAVSERMGAPMAASAHAAPVTARAPSSASPFSSSSAAAGSRSEAAASQPPAVAPVPASSVTQRTVTLQAHVSGRAACVRVSADCVAELRDELAQSLPVHADALARAHISLIQSSAGQSSPPPALTDEQLWALPKNSAVFVAL